MWQFAPSAYDRIYFPAVGPDGDRDNLLDAWESSHGLCPYRRHTTDAYTHIGDENGGSPGDPEVVADVIAYGQLLNAEIEHDPRTGQATWRSDGLRRHDWLATPLSALIRSPGSIPVVAEIYLITLTC
jgi:hypothetical protein